jgi:transposase
LIYFYQLDFFSQHNAFKISKPHPLPRLRPAMNDRDQPTAPACPHCHNTMQLVRHIARLMELPDFYIFYCPRCRHVETVKHERAA